MAHFESRSPLVRPPLTDQGHALRAAKTSAGRSGIPTLAFHAVAWSGLPHASYSNSQNGKVGPTLDVASAAGHNEE